jgi:hypothetical protein
MSIECIDSLDIEIYALVIIPPCGWREDRGETAEANEGWLRQLRTSGLLFGLPRYHDHFGDIAGRPGRACEKRLPSELR